MCLSKLKLVCRYIMDPLLVPVAAACYPLGALLNHSCYPNCVVSYHHRRRSPSSRAAVVVADDGGGGGGDGGGGGGGDGEEGGAPGGWIQEFRCARRVSAGEELCHAYVDASSPPGKGGGA